MKIHNNTDSGRRNRNRQFKLWRTASQRARFGSFATVLAVSLININLPLLAQSTNIAHTLSVGPGMTYALPSQAAALAQDGDQILISGSGNYVGDVAHWTQNNLTIEGVNGRPVLDARGNAINGKALWLVSGSNLVIKNLEFKNCSQGSGVMVNTVAPGNVQIQSCYIHDNQTGVLVSDNAASDVVLTNCEFNHNGSATTLAHNIDVGQVRSLNMQGCWSHDAILGDDLSSKASTNYILYNRIGDDSTGSTTAYQIALPSGGLSFILGNSIYKNSGSSNNQNLEYMALGNTLNASQNLYLINNTFATTAQHTVFVTTSASPNIVLKDNLFLGNGTILNSRSPKVSESNNLSATNSWFTNAAAYDFRLAAKSPAIGAGTAQGSAAGVSLVPMYQFELDSTGKPGVAARASSDALDAGAYGASATPAASQLAATVQSLSTGHKAATAISPTAIGRAVTALSAASPAIGATTSSGKSASTSATNSGKASTPSSAPTPLALAPSPSLPAPAPSNKLPRLGYYAGTPVYGNKGQTAAYIASYDNFSTIMGEQPLCFDTNMDHTIPWNDAPGNPGFITNGGNAAYSSYYYEPTKSMIPVAGIAMATSNGSAGSELSQLEDIAKGNHDDVWKAIVDAWAKGKYPAVYFRLGWEMNSNYMPWGVGASKTLASAWVAAFKEMVGAIRAEAKAKNIKAYIVWNPVANNVSNSSNPLRVDLDLYPGNEYVDVIALDLYSHVAANQPYIDVTTQKRVPDFATWLQNPANREFAWNGDAGGNAWGMKQHIAFAKSKGKPIALGETGAGTVPANADPPIGLNDDGKFPAWLAGRIQDAANDGVACEFATIWNINVADGSWQFTGGLQPNVQAAWIANFGVTSPNRTPSGTTPPPPPSTPHPTPPPPPPPPSTPHPTPPPPPSTPHPTPPPPPPPPSTPHPTPPPPPSTPHPTPPPPPPSTPHPTPPPPPPSTPHPTPPPPPPSTPHPTPPSPPASSKGESVSPQSQSRLTGHGSLPAVHSSLPTGHSSLPTGHGSLPTGHSSLPTGHGSLPAGHSSLPTGHGSLPTGHQKVGKGSLSAEHGSLPTGHQ